MNKAMLWAVLLLPGNALVVIPGVILWLTGPAGYSWDLAPVTAFRFWAACLPIAGGLTLMVRTVGLFSRHGDGTPAPWDPPRKLVVVGIYRHLRNPMISGVAAVLFGEALLFKSLALLAWAGIFLLANAIYIPLWEEPRLERRFGEGYRRYRRHVPRWFPRLKPWTGPERDD
ncbi:MAG: methyltransferase family protein [Kiloniellaceae bacterium]